MRADTFYRCGDAASRNAVDTGWDNAISFEIAAGPLLGLRMFLSTFATL